MKVRILILLVIISACKNVDDVNPSERRTFAYFYNGLYSRTGQAAVMADKGYIIVGNTLIENQPKIVVIKTDSLGKTEWEKTIDGAQASTIKLIKKIGYVIAGDSIKLNPRSTQISELQNTKARIISMDLSGNIAQDYSYGEQVITPTDTFAIDYSGDALTFDGDGNIVLLGTFQSPGGYENTFISTHNATSLQPIWTNQFGLLDKDYINGRSVQVQSNGNIIWATSALHEQQSFTRSYLVVPTVQPNSSFTNSDQYGQHTDQELFATDIQPAKLGTESLAVIGTFAATTGLDADIFFARISQSGTIEQESIKFFDGNTLGGGASQKSEDSGDALAGTSDGGFILAGTMTTTTERGNGDKDILLIKVDAFGNVQWNKLLGGTFTETVSTIQEVKDGGFLICGTHTFSGLSQIMLIRTDKNGDLIN